MPSNNEERNETENAVNGIKSGATTAGSLIKRLIATRFKIVLVAIIIVVMVIVLLAGSLYYIKDKLSKPDDNDPKNAVSAVKKFMSDTEIDENGNIVLGKSAQEFWDEMVKNNNNILRYLSSPKDVAKLMNAQMATEYLYTGEPSDKNKSEEKYKEESEKKYKDAVKKLGKGVDVNSKEVQGIVRLKRSLSNGKTIYMQYVSPKELQDKINKYKKSGSKADRDEALRYFTLEKTITTTSSSTGTGGLSQAEQDEIQKKIVEFLKSEGFADNQEGYTIEERAKTAMDAWSALKGANFSDEAAAGVLGNMYGESSFNPKNYGDVSLTNTIIGKSADAVNAFWETRNNESKESFRNNGFGLGLCAWMVDGANGNKNELYEYIKEKNNGRLEDARLQIKFLVEQLLPGGISAGLDTQTIRGYTKESWKNATSAKEAARAFGYWFENFGDLADAFAKRERTAEKMYDILKGKGVVTNIDVSTSSSSTTSSSNTTTNSSNNNATTNKSNTSNSTAASSATSHWPTQATYISSDFGLRIHPVTGEWTGHEGIDIAGKSGDNIEAAEAGTVIKSGYLGNAGNCVVLDHGNGVVTWYMHMLSDPPVKVGDVVSKGQVIGQMGSTGRSTGPHLHFEIDIDGTPVSPWDYKYDNGQGNGTSGIGSTVQGASSSTQATQTTSSYVAKVATFSETTYGFETNDSRQKDNNPAPSYNMTMQNVDYRNYVSGYTMPFNYLWAMLLIGEDKDFVFDLADLVFNSKFEITIKDNEKTTTDVVTNRYKYKTRAVAQNIVYAVDYKLPKEVDVNPEQVSERAEDTSSQQYEGQTKQTTYVYVGTNHIGGYDDKDNSEEHVEIDPPSGIYYTKNTTINTTNTLDISLTLADAWCARYEEKVRYSHADKHQVGFSENILKDTEETKETHNGDIKGIAEGKKAQVKSDYESSYPPRKADVSVEKTTTYLYKSTINRSTTTENYLETSQYTKTPGKVEEKTDKDHAPNFVTVFQGNYNARSNIMSATSWLFKILGNNDDTKDMIDLTKYLLYKATGTSFGVTEFDFNVFNMTPVTGSMGGILSITSTTFTKEEFVSKVQSYSPALNNASGTARFRDNAGVIYDVCKKNNINPVLCAAQAWAEQGWDDPSTSPFNYWGIAVYNGQNFGNAYQGMEKAVQDYCDNINARLKGENGALEWSKRCSQYNKKFSGSISTIYDVLSNWACADDANSNYEHQATHASNYVDMVMECANNIFGAGALTAYGSSSTVVEFAKQFEGKNATEFGLFNYRSQCGADNIWYADHWCAMFVSFCFDSCKMIPNPLPISYAACEPGWDAMPGLVSYKESYTPKSGDIIFFYHGHTGIVDRCDGSKVYTVEGNTGSYNFLASYVQCKEYSINDADIKGYARTGT